MLVAPARAHDPFELTTAAQVRPDALVLKVTMARSTALAVANDVSEAPTFDPEKFDELRPRFLARAPAIFTVSSGGTVVAPRAVAVELGREQDVVFKLTYPRPAPGPLRLACPPLAKLGAGFGNVLQVRGETGAPLGEKLLGATDAALELNLPGGATVGDAAPRPRFQRGPASAAVLFMLALLLWARTRSKIPVTHA